MEMSIGIIEVLFWGVFFCVLFIIHFGYFQNAYYDFLYFKIFSIINYHDILKLNKKKKGIWNKLLVLMGKSNEHNRLASK